MKVSFRSLKKGCFQLTDGSVIFLSYLFEKDHNKLDIDLRSHRLWRFNSKEVRSLSLIDKRIMKFNSRLIKKK